MRLYLLACQSYLLCRKFQLNQIKCHSNTNVRMNKQIIHFFFFIFSSFGLLFVCLFVLSLERTIKIYCWVSVEWWQANGNNLYLGTHFISYKFERTMYVYSTDGPFVNGIEMTTNRELFIVIIMWWYLSHSHSLYRGTLRWQFVLPHFSSNTLLLVNLVAEEICSNMIIMYIHIQYMHYYVRHFFILKLFVVII